MNGKNSGVHRTLSFGPPPPSLSLSLFLSLRCTIQSVCLVSVRCWCTRTVKVWTVPLAYQPCVRRHVLLPSMLRLIRSTATEGLAKLPDTEQNS